MTDDDARLRREGDRVEALLGELSTMSGPQVWPRIEELLQRTVALYGAGLGRVLAHARACGADGAALDERLVSDELVSTLLVLHGLHPRSIEERVERALERVRPYLGSHGGGVELAGVEHDTVRLRLAGSCEGCPSSRATLERTVRQAIEEDAPEIARIELAGIAERALVSIGPRPRARWEDVAGLDRIERGERIDVAGRSVLVLRVAGALVAYASRCRACGAPLDPSRLAGPLLECTCGRRYDVARGGRAEDGDAPHLEPLPLLPGSSGHRIALEDTP